MASLSGKTLRCVGRSNFTYVYSAALTPKVTFATALSAAAPPGKKGPPLRRGRRPPPKRPIGESDEPRTARMPLDQDWTAVYPTAAPFRANSVPLPVRMGYPMKRGVAPAKEGNLELIKIPNFLHLTPAAIKKHCDALKAFCTEWPSALNTDAKCDEHFPVKVESKSFLSAGLSIRNPAARIVQLRVKLSSLNLDEHAQEKLHKLAGKRYCKQTDTLTITTDSCPLKKQNYDYAKYLLTVLYHESWKIEPWEAEKTVADREVYIWEDGTSQKNILDTLIRMKLAEGKGDQEAQEQLLGRREVQEYKDSVTRLMNEGESENTLLQYKEAVKKVLSM